VRFGSRWASNLKHEECVVANKKEKKGEKRKKDKKGKRGKLSGHTNPHKVAEFDDFAATGIVNANAAMIRSAMTALQMQLAAHHPIPANYISIVRIQPRKTGSSIAFSPNCGCGCS